MVGLFGILAPFIDMGMGAPCGTPEGSVPTHRASFCPTSPNNGGEG